MVGGLLENIDSSADAHALHSQGGFLLLYEEVARYAQAKKVDILITDTGDQIIMPTAEESKAIDERIASDPDGFELDDAWFAGVPCAPIRK